MINVTTMPFMPYWDEVKMQTSDGTSVSRYEGSDFQHLMFVAAALNFTFRVLPSDSWAEVREGDENVFCNSQLEQTFKQVLPRCIYINFSLR